MTSSLSRGTLWRYLLLWVCIIVFIFLLNSTYSLHNRNTPNMMIIKNNDVSMQKKFQKETSYHAMFEACMNEKVILITQIQTEDMNHVSHWLTCKLYVEIDVFILESLNVPNSNWPVRRCLTIIIYYFHVFVFIKVMNNKINN